MITDLRDHELREPPRVEKKPGEYLFRWYALRVKARVDRVVATSRHVNAEVLIQTFEEDHLYYSTVNLTDGLERRRHVDAAKADTPRLEGAWPLIFDAVCQRTLEDYRSGNPWVRVADMEAPADVPEYLLPGILERGETTVFFADGGVGKSLLAQALAVQVARLEPVAYLDWETSTESFWRRINGLANGMNIAIPEDIHYRAMSGKVAANAADVRAFIAANKIGLVIIDSAAYTAGESEASQPVTEMFDAIRTWQTTALVIAHVPKAGDSDRPFGSVFMRNGPRSVFKITSDKDRSALWRIVTLHNVKTNNSGPIEDKAWRFNFKEDGRVIEIERADANLIDEVADSQSLSVRVRELLAESGAMYVSEIAGALDLASKQRSIQQVLRRGKDREFVMLEQDGKAQKWGLARRETGL